MAMTHTNQYPTGLDVVGEVTAEYANILTPEAIHFVSKLERAFGDRRRALLEKRQERQQEIDAGKLPDFLEETAHIRKGNWSIEPLPDDLQDRRVEITGPAGDRKMVINALNSGAKIFMADFEDANSPTWANTIQGQINLKDAIRRTISYTSPEGKRYALNV